MSKILIYISAYTKTEDIPFVLAHNKTSSAASTIIYNTKLVKALRPFYDSIYFLSSPPIGSFPNHSSILRFRGFYKDKDFYAVAHSNLWGYRNVSIGRALIRSFKKRILPLLSTGDLIDVVAVEAHEPFLKAACFIKKCLSLRCTFTLVAPDLPTAMNPLKHSFVYNFFKARDNNMILRHCAHADGFIFLSSGMKDYFQVGSRPFLISEGMYSGDFSTPSKPIPGRVVYTGTIAEKYSGTKTILDCARYFLTKSSFVTLVIAGSGDVSDFKKQIKELPNVLFLGKISPEDSAQLQKTASVLISPRPDLPELANSFPSKLLEYIGTGRPVVSFRLRNFPAEYSSILYFPENSDSVSFALAIEKCLNLSQDELADNIQKSHDFLQEKTPSSVGKKIMCLLDEERKLLK